MKLFFRKYGVGNKAIIILHGLYGSSDNWVSIAKKISQDYCVYVLDQRNHGQSLHDKEFNYNVLINDLHDFISENKINNPIIIGHSMGGKVAMYFNFVYPDIAEKIIIIDIAPKNYSNEVSYKFHKKLLLFMSRINLQDYYNRKDLSDFIFSKIGDKRLTHFILKNIKKSNNGFEWKINLEIIKNEYENILIEDFNKKINNITTPTLFIKAENSNYIKQEDFDDIRKKFLNSEIITISNTSHWVHSEKPDELCKIILDFVN